MNIEQAAIKPLEEILHKHYSVPSQTIEKAIYDAMQEYAESYHKSHISERMKTLREEFFDECVDVRDLGNNAVYTKSPANLFDWLENKLNQ